VPASRRGQIAKTLKTFLATDVPASTHSGHEDKERGYNWGFSFKFFLYI